MGYGYGRGTTHEADAINLESGKHARKIFDNSMTAHVWAQGVQTFGQSNNGNLYFRGRTLYSYGEHFPLGFITANGEILLNADSYSVTTAQHKGDASAAVRGRVVYTVPSLDSLLCTRSAPTPRSGSLEATARADSYFDARLADREHVRAFVESHVLSMGAHDAQFLLAGVGLPNSLAKIEREAKAAKDRREAAKEAKAVALALDNLKGWAFAYRKGPDVLAARIARLAPEYMLQNSDGARDMIERVQGDIRSNRRTVGKDRTPPAQWRDAWAALKALDGMESDVADAMRSLALKMGRDRARKYLRDAIANYRGDLDATARFDREGAHPYERACAFINAARLRARYASALAGQLPAWAAPLAKKLEAQAEGLREVETEASRSPRLNTLREAYEEERAAREQAKREERAKALADYKRAWLAGEEVRPPYGAPRFARDNGAAYIRATGVERDAAGNITGGTLETSEGADVPLPHAIKAFRFIKLVRDRGRDWHANGQQVRVGHFSLDWIDSRGNMKAGCHRFDWQDIAALAESLGVFALPASDDAVSLRKLEAA